MRHISPRRGMQRRRQGGSNKRRRQRQNTRRRRRGGRRKRRGWRRRRGGGGGCCGRIERRKRSGGGRRQPRGLQPCAVIGQEGGGAGGREKRGQRVGWRRRRGCVGCAQREGDQHSATRICRRRRLLQHGAARGGRRRGGRGRRLCGGDRKHCRRRGVSQHAIGAQRISGINSERGVRIHSENRSAPVTSVAATPAPSATDEQNAADAAGVKLDRT